MPASAAVVAGAVLHSCALVEGLFGGSDGRSESINHGFLPGLSFATSNDAG